MALSLPTCGGHLPTAVPSLSSFFAHAARFYRKLARRQQLVWFGYVDASSNPEIARDLGLKAVPSFVTFRQGEVVTSTNTNSRDKIEKLVEELLLG